MIDFDGSARLRSVRGAARLGLALIACLAFSCGDDDADSAPMDGGAGAGSGSKAGSSGSKAGSSGSADAGGAGGSGSGAIGSECSRGCTATLQADCAMGPATREMCESDCERLRSGSCGSEYRTLMDCADGEAIECSSGGFPTIPACSSEQGAFVDCLNN